MMDLKECYEGNRISLCAVMRKKMKPGTEFCGILDTNGRLA
jgi:hypothetical protein